MRRHVEVEWQFELHDLGAFRRWIASERFGDWEVAPRRRLTLRDTYCDTVDWRVLRSGYALRVRRADSAVEATLKAVTRGRRGMAVRREITSRVRDARPASLLRARGRVSARVRRVIAGQRVQRLFRLRTRRERFTVSHRGRDVAELVLDRTRIVGRTVERRLERVEIEVTRGTPALVARFVATLRRRRHLTVARRSKFEEGLRVAALTPPRVR